MKLRIYKSEDLQEINRLFHDTIYYINIGDYSPLQVRIWSERKLTDEFFRSLYTLVAEDKGVIVGYGNISDKGYIDHLYVHRSYQGKGVGTLLCNTLEEYVASTGVKSYTVHASITAKNFFKKRGYQVVREQLVYLEQVPFTNYLMEKSEIS